jgi:phenylalanyl-tRNA synthetase beta chain
MLCSGAELELDTDADGIFELDSALKVGTPLADALGLNDPVIDIEVTPNRPDWLGVAGIARDLAAAGVGKQTTKPVLPVPGRYKSPQQVATEDTHACPMFAGRFIRGVKNGPSPAWLQQRLRAIGQKPISALVDITNLITHDRSRPLHVYDAAKLNGVVRARMGRDGESFKALNGNVYNVTPAMCVIADDERVLGLGGVIGIRPAARWASSPTRKTVSRAASIPASSCPVSNSPPARSSNSVAASPARSWSPATCRRRRKRSFSIPTACANSPAST